MKRNAAASGYRRELKKIIFKELWKARKKITRNSKMIFSNSILILLSIQRDEYRSMLLDESNYTICIPIQEEQFKTQLFEGNGI